MKGTHYKSCTSVTSDLHSLCGMFWYRTSRVKQTCCFHLKRSNAIRTVALPFTTRVRYKHLVHVPFQAFATALHGRHCLTAAPCPTPLTRREFLHNMTRGASPFTEGTTLETVKNEVSTNLICNDVLTSTERKSPLAYLSSCLVELSMKNQETQAVEWVGVGVEEWGLFAGLFLVSWFVCFPATCTAYLRHRFAQTALRAVTLRQKLLIKLVMSPSHGSLTPNRPVSTLTR